MSIDCRGFCSVPEPAGAEPANWPFPCRKQLKVAIHPGFETHRAFAKCDVRATVKRALDAWSEVIGVGFTILDEYTETGSEIFLKPAALPGSTLADSYLAQNTCHTALRQRYDTTITWDEGMLYSTVGHEIGHALGLHHHSSRSALMFFQITGPEKGPHSLDVAQAKRLGYGEPFDDNDGGDDQEPPPPPPPDDENDMDNIFDLLIKIALEMVGDCLTDQSKDAVISRLASGDRLVKWRLKRAVRQAAIETHDRKYWRRNRAELVAAALDEYERASLADLEDFVEAASEPSDEEESDGAAKD